MFILTFYTAVCQFIIKQRMMMMMMMMELERIGLSQKNEAGRERMSKKMPRRIGGKLALIINRKSYMSFRLVPKLVTLNDPEL